jgi:hypothetical protein
LYSVKDAEDGAMENKVVVKRDSEAEEAIVVNIRVGMEYREEEKGLR